MATLGEFVNGFARYLLVAVGGGLGSMLRYFVGTQAMQRFGPRFPVGTLFINVTACFILGLILEVLSRHTEASPAWRFLLAIGFTGGYSTFSTFEWEIWRDMTTGEMGVSLLYLAVSIAGGLMAVGFGTAVARRVA